MTFEKRIKLRDEIFELLKSYSFLIATRANNWRFNVKNEEFKDKLNKDKKLKELYELYVKQFRTEDEAIYNILHQDDYLNHLCKTCNNLCKFYNRNKGYRDSCGNKKCRANLRNVKKINKKVKETKKRKNNEDKEIIINMPIKLIKISSDERIKLRDELLCALFYS